MNRRLLAAICLVGIGGFSVGFGLGSMLAHSNLLPDWYWWSPF